MPNFQNCFRSKSNVKDDKDNQNWDFSECKTCQNVKMSKPYFENDIPYNFQNTQCVKMGNF